MNRDEINKAMFKELPLKQKNSKSEFLIDVVEVKENISIVFYRKIKNDKMGRVRAMDLVTFSKMFYLKDLS